MHTYTGAVDLVHTMWNRAKSPLRAALMGRFMCHKLRNSRSLAVAAVAAVDRTPPSPPRALRTYLPIPLAESPSDLLMDSPSDLLMDSPSDSLADVLTN